MGKKTKTENSYQYMTRPDTADTTAARNAVKNIDLTTPVVNSYGQAEKELNDDQFYDQKLPDGANEKIKYARMFNLNQQKGAALAQATAQQEQMKTSGMMNMAQLTQSPLVQTGSTTYQPFSFGDALAGGLAGAGSMASGLGAMGVT